jgi:hypothetical protein
MIRISEARVEKTLGLGGDGGGRVRKFLFFNFAPEKQLNYTIMGKSFTLMYVVTFERELTTMLEKRFICFVFLLQLISQNTIVKVISVQ